MTDDLEQYKRRVERIPELSREQTAELLERIRSGDGEARSELAEPMLKVVVAVAGECYRRAAWRGLTERELIRHGNVTLLLAASRFAEEPSGDLDAYLEAELIASLERYVRAYPRGA